MYEIVTAPITGENVCIKRTADNAFIPFDPANTDYQEYLRWCEAGNVPLPADAPEGEAE